MLVWKVGELARLTGLTVRTLHHYDRIGLLSPAGRSEAGYRLYAQDDIVRLQQIVSLRQLGFSLQEIRACLAAPEMSLPGVIGLHLARLEQQIAQQQELHARLQALAEHVRTAETISVAELTHTIEAIVMSEKYYPPEQLEQLAERKDIVGAERIREVEAEWPELMAEVRAEMEKGTDPGSERVQQLARRWAGLVGEFTGGDPAITSSLNAMYRQEPEVAGMQTGAMREMGEYVGRALAAGSADAQATKPPKECA